jgi:hypothetical protein
VEQAKSQAKSEKNFVAVLAATSVAQISRAHETDCAMERSIQIRREFDEEIDPIGCWSRHHFPCKRSSDFWHKLARPSMSLSGAVFSRGMARHWCCSVGGGLLWLEGG